MLKPEPSALKYFSTPPNCRNWISCVEAWGAVLTCAICCIQQLGLIVRRRLIAGNPEVVGVPADQQAAGLLRCRSGGRFKGFRLRHEQKAIQL